MSENIFKRESFYKGTFGQGMFFIREHLSGNVFYQGLFLSLNFYQGAFYKKVFVKERLLACPKVKKLFYH